ncbi:hypothetical protein ALC57_18741 [Trachymyrmex cornetzi]|uniref:Uncharacterized protein n=1 Tax=Trachymyrmex cornetzi TaxID=471704 RepID=A0A151IRH9_9HYME|nr:hypothetical protein ALC57_18741 [Trachymyrmex cornetzi]
MLSRACLESTNIIVNAIRFHLILERLQSKDCDIEEIAISIGNSGDLCNSIVATEVHSLLILDLITRWNYDCRHHCHRYHVISERTISSSEKYVIRIEAERSPQA